MQQIINILFFILILFITYLIIQLLHEAKVNEKLSNFIKVKNEKYYNDVLKHYTKNNNLQITSKLNLFHKINILLDKSGVKFGILGNPVTILFLCIASFVICFLITYSIMKIILLSFVIALPGALIPVAVLKYIGQYKTEKIEASVLDFILQIRNYTRINNDIVYAFKQVKTISPLQDYIDTFIIEINSGVKFEKAIDNLKEKVALKKLKELFLNIQHCYLCGGDFSELMRKSYVTISKIQNEKKKRISETKNARIVLGILIFLDLFVYFSYIKDNYQNYLIMTSSIIGTLILYWNFISIWGLLFLMNRVQKLDY